MLEKNLQALSMQNPSLAQKILYHQAQDVDFDIAESGDYNIIYKGVHLHDTKNPQLEAKLIFGDNNNEENKLQLVFGLGLGYLFKRAYIGSAGSIIVFEPSLDVLRSTLEVVEFSEEIADKRVFIINELSELESVFLKYLYDNVTIMHLDSYMNMYPGMHEKVYFELNRLNLDQKTNIIRSIDMSKAFVISLPHFKKAPPVNILENKFKNKAALVVSAGPSLDSAIDLIKENRNKFIIISIGQAFGSLYKAGIMPDLVMILDTYFSPEWFSCVESTKDNLNLVLATSVQPQLWELETKTKFAYYSGHDYMTNWILKRIGHKSLESGATVSITSVYLAKLMGANPIILIGQDLAFKDNRVYAANSIHDFLKITIDSENKTSYYAAEPEVKTNSKINGLTGAEYVTHLVSMNALQHKSILTVKGWNGENVPTSSTYASFITEYNQMAEDFKQKYPHIRIINTSEGGAYLEGFEHLQLKEVIKDLPNLNIDLNTAIYEEYTSNKTDSMKVNEIDSSLKSLIKDLKNLKEDAQKVTKLANRILNDLKRTNNIPDNSTIDMIQKLQKYDKSVRSYNVGDRISFVYPFIQKELYEYNKLNDKKVESNQEKLVNGINSIKKFSENMIIASDRMIETYNSLIIYEKSLVEK